jgi:hypothetical protein
MEITILTLVGIAFFSGVIGGLVIAESFDLEETESQKLRRQRRARRHQRRARNW